MVVVFCVKVMKVRIDKLTCPRRGSWKIEIWDSGLRLDNEAHGLDCGKKKTWFVTVDVARLGLDGPAPKPLFSLVAGLTLAIGSFIPAR